MLDPYDPPHPDGPIDEDDVPAPLSGPSWLDDEDADSVASPFFFAKLDPE